MGPSGHGVGSRAPCGSWCSWGYSAQGDGEQGDLERHPDETVAPKDDPLACCRFAARLWTLLAVGRLARIAVAAHGFPQCGPAHLLHLCLNLVSVMEQWEREEEGKSGRDMGAEEGSGGFLLSGAAALCCSPRSCRTEEPVQHMVGTRLSPP